MARLADLTPDPNNANRGTERGRGMLEDSLRQLGAGRSILIDRHGRVIAGNKTLEVAADIGLEDVIIVQSDGTKLVAVQRTDWDLETDAAAKRYALADNRVGQVDLDFDPVILAALQDADASLLAGLWTDGELEAVLAGMDPFGDTSTDRNGQGVSSTWDQVGSTDNQRVIIGDIETRLPADVVQMLSAFLTRVYEIERKPIYETLESVIVAGVRAVESGSG